MIKITRSERLFIASTLTVAVLTTIEVTPKIVELYNEKVNEKVQIAKVQRKKSASQDDFTIGFMTGLVVGTLGTVKVIADKLNAP